MSVIGSALETSQGLAQLQATQLENQRRQLALQTEMRKQAAWQEIANTMSSPASQREQGKSLSSSGEQALKEAGVSKDTPYFHAASRRVLADVSQIQEIQQQANEYRRIASILMKADPQEALRYQDEARKLDASASLINKRIHETIKEGLERYHNILAGVVEGDVNSYRNAIRQALEEGLIDAEDLAHLPTEEQFLNDPNVYQAIRQEAMSSMSAKDRLLFNLRQQELKERETRDRAKEELEREKLARQKQKDAWQREKESQKPKTLSREDKLLKEGYSEIQRLGARYQTSINNLQKKWQTGVITDPEVYKRELNRIYSLYQNDLQGIKDKYYNLGINLRTTYDVDKPQTNKQKVSIKLPSGFKPSSQQEKAIKEAVKAIESGRDPEGVKKLLESYLGQKVEIEHE
jgi:hypothetical protein